MGKSASPKAVYQKYTQGKLQGEDPALQKTKDSSELNIVTRRRPHSYISEYFILALTAFHILQP